MDEDIKDFFLSMADELRTTPDAPSDLLLRRVRRRRLRTVGATVLALAVVSAGTVGAIRAFGGPRRPAPAEGACSKGWSLSPARSVGYYTFLSGLAAASPDDVWAVGSVGGNPSYPLVEHWDGERWSVVPSPRLLGAELGGVDVVSGTDIWAVGADTGARTLIEHWDGRRWSVLPSPNFVQRTWKHNVLAAVSGTAPEDVWAVGWTGDGSGRRARALIEHWDGSSWSLVTSPHVDSKQVVLYDVASLGHDDVWAVGQQRIGPSTRTLVLHWDGSAWSVVQTPNPEWAFESLWGVAGVGPDDVWAVGRASDQGLVSLHPIVMHWDGSGWTLIRDLPSDHPYGLEAVDAAGPDNVWAGDKAIPYAYALHWDGRRWSLVAPPGGPIKGGLLNGIVAFSDGEALAVGSRSSETGMSPVAVHLCSSARSASAG